MILGLVMGVQIQNQKHDPQMKNIAKVDLIEVIA